MHKRANFKPMDFDMDCLEPTFKNRMDNLKDIYTIMELHSNLVFKIMQFYEFFIFLNGDVIWSGNDLKSESVTQNWLLSTFHDLS